MLLTQKPMQNGTLRRTTGRFSADARGAGAGDRVDCALPICYTFRNTALYAEFRARFFLWRKYMFITCLDLEGVLVPEIWIAFAEAAGIPELRRTTRDEPDYDKLMRFRLSILKERRLGIREIQEVIKTIEPLPGAREFLDELRASTQAVILSDTFEQFAAPLMQKLGRPTLMCNTLDVSPAGEITGYRMRCEQSKLATVRALQSIGYKTIAAGDSFNDLAMIEASAAGFLFRAPDSIAAAHPDIPALTEYDELLSSIKNVIGR